jgi:hypothetical protein
VSVELEDLVEFLKVEVNPPGVDLFPDATDDEWLTRLRNAFWTARMDGFFPSFTEADGSVLPLTAGPDMDRELQQVIVFLAGYTAVMNELRNKRASFRAKAGAAEFETTQAATVLTAQSQALREQLQRILFRLSDMGVTPVEVIDSLVARTESLGAGITSWVR